MGDGADNLFSSLDMKNDESDVVFCFAAVDMSMKGKSERRECLPLGFSFVHSALRLISKFVQSVLFPFYSASTDSPPF